MPYSRRKAAEFQKSIRLLASLSVRLVLAGRTRTGTIETTFGETAVGVHDGSIADTRALKQALKAVIISDSDFQEEFSNARVSNASLARYYLQALEAAYADEDEPWYVENEDPTVMTLEHVLPQNAKGPWDGIDPDIRRCWLDGWAISAS